MKANELSCKDLMVGDWVKIKITQHNTKVTNIDANSVYTEAAFPIRYDEIEPIPLTPEILEKNGFRIIFEGELHTTYFQDIEGFHVEIKIDKIGYIKLSMINGLGYSIVTECKFVHQLQHALRLCEIEKEIIL